MARRLWIGGFVSVNGGVVMLRGKVVPGGAQFYLVHAWRPMSQGYLWHRILRLGWALPRLEEGVAPHPVRSHYRRL